MSRSPISILQELLVRQKEPTPNYTFMHSDNAQYAFKCSVTTATVCCFGYGTSKQGAKQNCAQAALEKLNFPLNSDTNNNGPEISQVPQQPGFVQNSSSHTHNFVGHLNEIASIHGKKYPEYTDTLATDGSIKSSCSFLKWNTEGFGYNKKIAKQDSAKKMLNILSENVNCLDALIIKDKQRQENINKFTEAILQRLEQQTVTQGSYTTSKISPDKYKLPEVAEGISSLDDLLDDLKKKGHVTELEIFQEDPYIVSLKIKDTSAVVMGSGESKEEALKDLFIQVYTMCSNSFTFTKTFL